jgi:hypothetical protein
MLRKLAFNQSHLTNGGAHTAELGGYGQGKEPAWRTASNDFSTQVPSRSCCAAYASRTGPRPATKAVSSSSEIGVLRCWSAGV